MNIVRQILIKKNQKKNGFAIELYLFFLDILHHLFYVKILKSDYNIID